MHARSQKEHSLLALHLRNIRSGVFDNSSLTSNFAMAKA